MQTFKRVGTVLAAATLMFGSAQVWALSGGDTAGAPGAQDAPNAALADGYASSAQVASTAVGVSAVAGSIYNTAVGSFAATGGSDAVAVGSLSTAGATHSTSVGRRRPAQRHQASASHHVICIASWLPAMRAGVPKRVCSTAPLATPIWST